jgi:hypothetical protein
MNAIAILSEKEKPTVSLTAGFGVLLTLRPDGQEHVSNRRIRRHQFPSKGHAS